MCLTSESDNRHYPVCCLPVLRDHEIQNGDEKNEPTDDEFKFFILFFEFEPLLLIDERDVYTVQYDSEIEIIFSRQTFLNLTQLRFSQFDLLSDFPDNVSL